MHQLSFAGLALLAFARLGSATPIADLAADFAGPTFPTGWSYLRNTGVIGDDSNYVPLLWDSSMSWYDVTGLGFPAPGPPRPDFTHLGSGGHTHPGRGTAQGVGFDGYFIAAYEIQAGEAGFISLINGSLTGADPNGASGSSNGWDIRIFVANTQVGSTTFVPWSLNAFAFSRALGLLNVGDTVYVALGPNGNHLFDAAYLTFQLDSTPVSVPEPATLLLMGAGFVSIAAYRYRTRRARE